MYYQRLMLGNIEIEFHNSWTGVEQVFTNGQLVSEKYSVWGTHHYFSMQEDGQKANYILTTKVNAALQILLDISKNGELIRENVSVAYGSMPAKPQEEFRKRGLKLLQEFDLEAALSELDRAREIAPKDPEIYFHMACAYSVLEEVEAGFGCLRRAVELGWPDTNAILTHDMLAFLRLQPAFEDFQQSGFREFDLAGLELV